MPLSHFLLSQTASTTVNAKKSTRRELPAPLAVPSHRNRHARKALGVAMDDPSPFDTADTSSLSEMDWNCWLDRSPAHSSTPFTSASTMVVKHEAAESEAEDVDFLFQNASAILRSSDSKQSLGVHGSFSDLNPSAPQLPGWVFTPPGASSLNSSFRSLSRQIDASAVGMGIDGSPSLTRIPAVGSTPSLTASLTEVSFDRLAQQMCDSW